jgi:hypothetical protein
MSAEEAGKKDAPPTTDYVPTARETASVKKLAERRKSKSSPSLKISKVESVV